MKPLTTRQRARVYRLRYQGYSDKGIADKLGVAMAAIRTVKRGGGRPRNGPLTEARKREVAAYITRTGCGTRFAAEKFGHSRDTILLIRQVYLGYVPPSRNYTRTPDQGTYQPTQAQIRAACLEIQKSWSETERWMRQVDHSYGLAPAVRIKTQAGVAARLSALEYNTVRQGRTGASHLHQVG